MSEEAREALKNVSTQELKKCLEEMLLTKSNEVHCMGIPIDQGTLADIIREREENGE